MFQKFFNVSKVFSMFIFTSFYCHLGDNVTINIQMRRTSYKLNVDMCKFVELESNGDELFPTKEAIKISVQPLVDLRRKLISFIFFSEKDILICSNNLMTFM